MDKAITIADNEEFLRQVSSEVNFSDEDLEKNIKILDEYVAYDDRVLALAAVQIGIPKRIIYLKNTNLELVNKKNNNQLSDEEELYNERRILINPVIVSRKGLTTYWETCASCLDNMGLVKRPYEIVIEYQDVKGIKHQDVFEGFESTVLSHEMDHLDGILHMDIADEVIVMPVEERTKFRKNHGYDIISKTGYYDKLLKEYSYQKKIGTIWLIIWKISVAVAFIGLPSNTFRVSLGGTKYYQGIVADLNDYW